MPKLQEIINCIESIAPLEYQENYDNSGLTLGNIETEIKGILISLDINESVIDEAIKKEFNLIIAHHPVIFQAIKKISNQNNTGKCLLKAINNNIAIYIAHTNLDNVLYGVSGYMAKTLNLENISILKEKKKIDSLSPKNLDLTKIGAGIIGELQKSIPGIEFLTYIKNVLGLKFIKHSTITNKKLKRVAICGGSGSEVIPEAISKKADVIITADVKYHTFFDMGSEIFIADIGHYESEVHTKKLLSSILSQSFIDTEILESNVNTNPVFYFS